MLSLCATMEDSWVLKLRERAGEGRGETVRRDIEKR